MDKFELSVMSFLGANGTCFVSSQYAIPYKADIDSGGSLPDFIALRPALKECWLVEVTASGSVRSLSKKFLTAEKQWLRSLRHHLLLDKIIENDWTIGMLAFIRQDKIAEFIKLTDGVESLVVWPLDFTLTHWKWPSIVRSPEFDFRSSELAT